MFYAKSSYIYILKIAALVVVVFYTLHVILQQNQPMKTAMHFKCRGGKYPFSNISRLVFPDSLVPWSASFESYSPPEYNSPALKGKLWADADLGDANFNPKWNSLDGNINRVSFMGNYLVKDSRPLNPIGRTGIAGRGVLGRWGPNHAADPVVTRWKMRNDRKELHPRTKLPILQFCAIQRRDNHQWAIPGGMVDPGEHISETLRREFLEEALNSLESSSEQLRTDKEMIEDFFKEGREIYKGYVDDPRNTDNSWMETVAYNFHDERGSSVGKFALRAGDDAKSVRWIDIDKDLDLYASHSSFVELVAQLHGAHWES